MVIATCSFPPRHSRNTHPRATFFFEVRWEILLVVICFYYLDAKVRNCMLLYVVFVTTSILFDVITLASMGTYEAS